LNARKVLLAAESLLGCLKLKGPCLLFLLLSIIIFNILLLISVVILLLLLLLVADFNQLSVTLSR
jgi:hypothetical protein